MQSDRQRQKQQLRRHFRALRGAVKRAERQRWTPQLNQHLLAEGAIQKARCVAAYLAFDGEPDLRFAMTQLHRRGTGIVVPVLPDSNREPLAFLPWTPATPLTPNNHGIAEPRDPGTSAAAGTAITLEHIDVMLLPLVAFDLHGGRLGMGAGWYDKTLADHTLRPLRVGVGWSLQRHERLPMDEWDQPLHAVLNEEGWFTCDA